MVMSLEIEGLILDYIVFSVFVEIKPSMIKNKLGKSETVDQLVALE